MKGLVERWTYASQARHYCVENFDEAVLRTKRRKLGVCEELSIKMVQREERKRKLKRGKGRRQMKRAKRMQRRWITTVRAGRTVAKNSSKSLLDGRSKKKGIP